MENNSSSTYEESTFYIGLCMAGAVSAGAYTAGVVDYLIEALEIWESKKKDETLKGQVPTHKVQIPVMGGASGGMTSIIAGTIFNNPLVHLENPGNDLLAEHPENKLYHSWVDLIDPDMFSRMLDISDIQSGKVISALNSSFIPGIANRVFNLDKDKWKPFPDFIHKNLKIFTTLTNLQGFDYSYDFQGTSGQDSTKYHSVIHNDYGCFQIEDGPIEEDTGNEGWMPLHLKDRIEPGSHVQEAIDSAMATGAFPVGLESRIVNRESKYVLTNRWLKDYLVPGQFPNNTYSSLNVDGGVINNEPFEKVRDVLNDITMQTEKEFQSANQFKSTVIMVEPFPTQQNSTISQDKGLLNIVKNTLGAMLNQMRSKPIDLREAMNDSKFGQFLITPSRTLHDLTTGEKIALTGEKAMACGALSGFSGFLNKNFRVHDYYLGRFNCQIFLRDYFNIPKEAIEKNPIFKDGYNLSPENLKRFESKNEGQKNNYQIIPIFEDPEKPFSFPKLDFKNDKDNWPEIQENDIEKFKGKIKTRVQKFILNVAPMNGITRFLIWAGTVVVLNRVISENILKAMKSELMDWKLLPKK